MSSSWSRWAAALLVSVAGGCKFDRPADVGPPIDAAPPDVAPVCTPNTKSCTTGRYTACDASGQYVTYVVPNGGPDGSATTLTMHDYECPMGCATDGTRCNDISVPNGFDALMDASEVSASGRDIGFPRESSVAPGTVIVDTGRYDAVGHTTLVTDADGVAVTVPARVITQSGGPPVLVMMVRTFTLRAGSSLRVRGTRAFGIASHFDVRIAGRCDLASAAPKLGSGPCGGMFGTSTSAGGGGHSTAGGRGAAGGIAGPAVSVEEPLLGGCDGGFTSGGGGAVQIASRTQIRLTSTALIDVSGAGAIGNSGVSFGGAAGGTVALYAPAVALEEGSTIAGRGGGGAAHGPGSSGNGAPGVATGTAPALGGTCGGCGMGGAGGTEAMAPGDGVGTSAAGGGGGGSVGVCYVRNASGVLAPPPGTIKISLSVFGLAVR